MKAYLIVIIIIVGYAAIAGWYGKADAYPLSQTDMTIVNPPDGDPITCFTIGDGGPVFCE